MIGSIPTGPIQSVVEQFSRPYSLDRREDRNETKIGSGKEYEPDAANADLYLYDPQANESVVDVGTQVRGELSGLALPDANVEVYDRLDYGDDRYQVMHPLRPIPDQDNPIVIQLSLERVTNV